CVPMADSHDVVPDGMPEATLHDRPPEAAPRRAARRPSPGIRPVARPAVKLVHVSTDARPIADPPAADVAAPPAPATLDGFLAGVGARAFRFAEAGLRHREDAMDAVQEAMMKMLAYR